MLEASDRDKILEAAREKDILLGKDRDKDNSRLPNGNIMGEDS